MLRGDPHRKDHPMPSRAKIASLVTLVALGVLAAVALASGSGGDPAAVQTQDDVAKPKVRTEIVRQTVHRRAKAALEPERVVEPDRGGGATPRLGQRLERPRPAARLRRPRAGHRAGRRSRRPDDHGGRHGRGGDDDDHFDDHGGDDDDDDHSGSRRRRRPQRPRRRRRRRRRATAAAAGAAAMTTERRRPAKLPAWPVAAGAAGTFLAALAFLAGQVRDGRDAALGPAEPVAARRQPRRGRGAAGHPPRRDHAPRAARRRAVHGGAAPAAALRPRRRRSAPAPARQRPGAGPRPRRPGARARPPDHPFLVTAVAAVLHELAFPAMGTRVRLLASAPSPLPQRRAEVERLAARLTRFDARSELCALNADPRAGRAGLGRPARGGPRRAARRRAHGRARRPDAARRARARGLRALADRRAAHAAARALAAAPPGAPRGRTPPPPGGAWSSTTRTARSRARRALRLDLGGSAKGFIADRAAALLARGPCAVDCGGDMRVRGAHEVLVAHPFGGEPAAVDRALRRGRGHLGRRRARCGAAPPTT